MLRFYFSDILPHLWILCGPHPHPDRNLSHSRMARDGFNIRSWRISAFFFSPPENPTFRSRSALFLIHLKDIHRFFQLLTKVPESDTASGSLLQCCTDKISKRNTRNFDRVLERKEDSISGSFCRRFFCNILTVKKICPSVISYLGFPINAYPALIFPAPLGPISTWVSPLFKFKSTLWRISLSSTFTVNL